MFTFIVGNIFFLVLDLTGKPACILKYKIQEEKGVPVSVCVCVCVTEGYVLFLQGKLETLQENSSSVWYKHHCGELLIQCGDVPSDGAARQSMWLHPPLLRHDTLASLLFHCGGGNWFLLHTQVWD